MPALILAVAAVFGSSALQPRPSSIDGLTAITNVTIIDVRDGRRIPDQTVVIENGRITAIGPARRIRTPLNAVIVDGRSRFLMPGLWDMHVHSSWPSFRTLFGALYLANGVTGVREMFGTVEDIAAWQTERAAGRLVAPRMIGAGHLLDGAPPIWPGSLVATDAARARQLVDSVAALGAAFIKVYNRLPREAYFAAAEEARLRGIGIAGHVPDAITIHEAAAVGQRSIEHLTGVAVGCASDEPEVRAVLDSAKGAVPRALRMRASALARSTFRAERCDSLFGFLRQQGTWQVPTLVVLRSLSRLQDSAFTNDPRAKYIPDEIVSSWDWRRDFRFTGMTDAGWADLKANYEHGSLLVGRMVRAGVPLLTGTDTPNPFVFAGFSLHDELGELVRVGASPLQALQAATISPARWFAATDSLGTVERGKCADLLLLSADPLQDIANTRRIEAVIAAGRVYQRAALDSLLADAQRRARGGR